MLFALFFLSLICLGCITVWKANEEYVIEPIDFKEQVTQLGRTYYDENNDVLWFNYTCSGVEFCFKGEKLTITFTTDSEHVDKENERAWISIYKNNELEPAFIFPLDEQKKEICLLNSKSTQYDQWRIVKNSEIKYGDAGICDISYKGEFLPIQDQKDTILFIGDSITCGNGILSAAADAPFRTEEENGNHTYASILCQKLNYNLEIVAYSGIGMAYSLENVGDLTMPIFFFFDEYKYGSRNEAILSTKKYDYIIINLGTNDQRFLRDAVAYQAFRQSYKSFIQELRALHEDAEIICTSGPMTGAMDDEIRFIVEETKDDNVHFFSFGTILEEEGYGTNNHPNIRTHKRMGESLYTFIQTLH